MLKLMKGIVHFVVSFDIGVALLNICFVLQSFCPFFLQFSTFRYMLLVD